MAARCLGMGGAKIILIIRFWENIKMSLGGAARRYRMDGYRPEAPAPQTQMTGHCPPESKAQGKR